jgi:hypothetical protein
VVEVDVDEELGEDVLNQIMQDVVENASGFSEEPIDMENLPAVSFYSESYYTYDHVRMMMMDAIREKYTGDSDNEKLEILEVELLTE